jgi:hypothetical protein
MTADERLLSAQKQIWSAQIHNLKTQIHGVRERIAKVPDELRKPLAPLMHELKEAENRMNNVEYALDSEMRDAMRHMALKDPDKCPA